MHVIDTAMFRATLFIHTYIHTTHAFSPRRDSSDFRATETRTFNQNDLAIRNTDDLTSGKPIAVRLHSTLCVSAVNPLVAFYVILRR
jgi:hypothetical protein